MKKNLQSSGERNVIADEIKQSVVITGDHNQVTVAAAPPVAAIPITPQRLAALWQDYAAQLAGKVSTVRIFGDEAPHALDQVFVELSLNEDYERRPHQAEFMGMMDSELRRMRSVFGDTERQPDDDDPTQRHQTKTKRTLKPDELLRRHTHAVITGAPGCGKTTLLRYLAWQTLKQWRGVFVVPPSGGGGSLASLVVAAAPLPPPEGGTTNARLPVFLELKQLTAAAFQAAQGQLEELLFAQAIAARLKPSDTERDALRQHFLELLRAGRVAVFLDGLDEVSGANFFGELQTAVSEFLSSAYGQNTVIISTRPYALRQFGNAKMLEILPLNPRQIEQFIEHYYREVPERQQFQRELQRRRELRELARVPALLGFILQLWRKRGSVTDDRLELYAQITLELAQQLDREKEGIAPDRQWLVEDQDGSLKLDLLRQLAFNQLFNGLIHPPYDIGSTDNDATRLVFTGEQLRDEAIAFARKLEECDGFSINPRNLAEDVKATALLRQVGADHYAFTFLALQEYLAATVLAMRDDCENLILLAYSNSFIAGLEVLPMAFGLTGKADSLYALLKQLPETRTFTNLQLRARGLSYGSKVKQRHIIDVVDKLIEFVVAKSEPIVLKETNSIVPPTSKNEQEEQIRLKYEEVFRLENIQEKGKALEALIEAVFTSIDGFETVFRNVETSTEEVDLIFSNNSRDPFWLKETSQFILVECKNWKSQRVGKDQIVSFRDKLENRFGRCKLGFLICTEKFATTIEKDMLRASKTDLLVVPIDGERLRKLVDAKDRNRMLLSFIFEAIFT